ncbi:hypothetical protein tinsulaeT_13920 [Thalassotalea insulae]|uniref:Uncharacterized protein n=1 Tax=Thalassotalea insulae TaxID=2056778 RepID=A0ABQ6GRL9_9GAMM|nr:hypothetical protein tinsulaeT_13920 [Thalassotalea insulae]
MIVIDMWQVLILKKSKSTIPTHLYLKVFSGYHAK